MLVLALSLKQAHNIWERIGTELKVTRVRHFMTLKHLFFIKCDFHHQCSAETDKNCFSDIVTVDEWQKCHIKR